jgi:hypothetical protein
MSHLVTNKSVRVLVNDQGVGVDHPGLNPIAIETIERATAKTCPAFRGSGHGNARAHTTGEGIRCLTCKEPQWKHWLRQAIRA